MNKPRVVLIPGRDASGAAAWPRQHGLALNFDALYLKQSEEKRVTPGEIEVAMGDRPSLLIAHGFGASAALRAAVALTGQVTALVLCEPELPQLTATRPFVGDAGIIPGIPTLVLTGGWEPVYERAAAVLVDSGAVHHVVPGSHRPQDSDEGTQLIRTFVTQNAR